MMKKRNLRIYILLWFFSMFVSQAKNVYADGKEVNVFRSVKKVRIEVEQSYGEAKGVSLPFGKIATKFFKHAGAEVVKRWEIFLVKNNYDAILQIKVKGKAVKSPYRVSLRKYGDEIFFEKVGKSDLRDYYTGAEVLGWISFEIIGGRGIERSFVGQVEPPRSIDFMEEKPITPEEAPFSEALASKGSFYFSMAKIIGEIYGVGVLIDALKDKDSFVRKGAVEALEEITGQNFGEDSAKWQKWWEENKGKFQNGR